MRFQTPDLRSPLLALAPLVVLLAACAGPLDGERDAFDRWTNVQSRTGWTASDGQSPSSLNDNGRSRFPLAADVSLPDEPTLDDYLAYALLHNPGVEAAFHEWKAALQRIPQARALMDPELSYKVYVRRMDQRQAIGLSQMFPWYEKLQARGDVALEQSLAAERRFERQRREIIFRVSEAYAEYAYTAKAIDVMVENQRMLREFEQAAQARFEAGAVPYSNLVRAGVAVEQIGDEIESRRALRGPLVGKLNAALGRPAHLDLPWPRSLDQPHIDLDEEAVLAQIARTSPDLLALGHETAGRHHDLRLARMNRIPDFMLGIEYMDNMDGARDEVALMAGINLPIWSGRIEAERAEALAEFAAAMRRTADRRYELESDLRLAWYRLADAQRRLSLFRDTLVPLAREALEASEAAYAAGEAEFQALTDTQTALLELQLTQERLVADRFTAVAEIERILGRSLGIDSEDQP